MYGWQQQQQILAMQMQMAAIMQMQQQQQLIGFAPPPNNVTDESEESDEDDEQRRTLFVANLDERVTEELLYECFVQAGPIESVRIPKDNAGKKRSFGFITYVHTCSAPYAHELLQGLSLFRKTLTIKFQGNSTVQHQRRSLPIGLGCGNGGGSGGGNSSSSIGNRSLDVEPIKRRSYDNSSLRGSNYPAYYDISMNDSTGSGGSVSGGGGGGGAGGGRNPFKHNSKNNWTQGSSSSRTNVKDRISRVPQKSRSPIEKHRPEADRDRNGRRHDNHRHEQRSRQRSRQRR